MQTFSEKKKTSSISGTPIRKKSKKASNPQKRDFWITEDQHFSHIPLTSISPWSIQPKFTIGKSNDKYEREADRVADAVMHMPDPQVQRQPVEEEEEQLQMKQQPDIQRKCEECEEEEKLQKKSDSKAQSVGANHASSEISSQLSSRSGTGSRLPKVVQTEMSHKIGADFSGVNIHTDATSHKLNRQLGARAFTHGRDIYFNEGEYKPDSSEGKHLLAHELTHVVQQSGRIDRQFIQRDPDDVPLADLEPATFSVPGTELTLIPGPLNPSLLGARIPLPSNLRITNALGLGPGPTFVLDASPELLVANILQTVDLYTWTRPGTPPGKELEPENQARISLTNPRVTLDPRSGRLRGSAILSVGSDYPPSIVAPTEIDVEIEATELGQFSGQLGLGPLHADFTLRLNYDTGRLEEALRPVGAPEAGLSGSWNRFQIVLRDAIPGITFDGLSDALQSLLSSIITGELQVTEFVTRTINLIREGIPAGADLEGLRTALMQFATEITHPGFTLSGKLGLDIPLLGTLPLTGFSAEAPTTVPLAQPLLGAPSALPLSFTAGGVIIAPPGSLSETAVPALGVTHSSFGEESGLSGTAALLPTLSTTAISAGEPIVNQFPVFAYAEISSVRRVSEDLELGLRLTVQVSTPELFGPAEKGSGDLGEQLTRALQNYREATQQGTSSTPVTPNVGLTLFGRFNAL